MKRLFKAMLVASQAIALTSARGESPGGSLGPIAMDSYEQSFTVTFRSEAAARNARLRIAPLYHDFRAAFSTRMDDCNLNDIRVAEVMARYGQKGTFFLNNPENWWQDNPITGVRVGGDLATKVPMRLLAGGNSIGGHTLSHEILPVLSKNDAFREILGSRVALETKSASPVLAFVYPNVIFRSEFRDGSDREDLEEMLRRAGIYQLGEHKYNQNWDSGLQDALFIVCDNSTNGGKYSERVLTRDFREGEAPLFLVTMHALVNAWGGAGYPKLAEIYQKWANQREWWYCNVNQYGAYRYQALHSRLATFIDGDVVRVVLTRPNPLDLNDWIPLTLRVEGISNEEVASVACDDAEVKPIPLEGSYAFDLFHSREYGMVEMYAEADNPANDVRFKKGTMTDGQMHALLYRRGHLLTLALRNDGSQPARNIRVVFRLPLRWEQGAIRRLVEPLAGGSSIALEIPLTERPDPEHYSDGTEYDVAQVDFQARQRARIYATCEILGDEPEAFFARDGFWVLGPMPGDVADFDPEAFFRAVLVGGKLRDSYVTPSGRNIAWKTLAPARSSILDPDVIPTTGSAYSPDYCTWDPSLYYHHKKVHFVLYGQIISPSERTVRAVCSLNSIRLLALNGRLLDSDELPLKKGANDLRILYAPTTVASSPVGENNYGCYFRLANADGKRVTDVRFERPPAP